MKHMNEMPGVQNEEVGGQSSLEQFRAEMAEKLRQEQAGEVNRAHFVGGEGRAPINPEELTAEDEQMWRKVAEFTHGGDLSDADFLDYKARVKADGNPSRRSFFAYLATVHGIERVKREVRGEKKS